VDGKILTASPIFEVQNVSFEYERIPALRGLSLTIDRGQSVALVGANGSGKSTLLRLLDALSFPSSGTISFCGDQLSPELFRNDGYALSFRRRVALVFQNPDVQLFNPTVFDEVAFGPLQMDWSSAEVVAKVDKTLQLMGIGHLRDRAPYRLSGGEKKRVALASVIVLDPEVLLLDEPTSMLDPRSQSQLIDLIQQWKGSAKTVITATHQLEIVEDIADRVFVLEQGSVAASGSAHDILSDGDLLLRANLVHAHRHKHGETTHSHPHLHSHEKHEH
jgi:cobalt/nickel transport system ATP-binding protein